MKKLIVLVILALVVWGGVNFIRTGKFTMMPVSVSPEQQHLADLEAELKALDAQIDQAGRAAGVTGMDTTADVSALMARKDTLQKEIADARAKVH